jgi:hypothetical protein
MWMAALLLTTTGAADDAHWELNPVFRSLRTDGVGEGGLQYVLPAPQFSDGQSPAQQEAQLSKWLEADFRPRFMRNSPVAPQIIKLGEQAGPGAAKIRHAEFLFSLYAGLDEVMQSDFFERLGEAATDAESELEASKSAEHHVLTDEELAARQIPLIPGADRRQAFAFGSVRLLKRVDVAATTHSCWSQTPQSVVAAFVVDPRFAQDAKYPNRWWPITRDDAGHLVVGQPQTYHGSGGYLRLTQLNTPPGCLLAEGYVAFVEPEGWFHGANLLASKLPTIVQTGIRRTRQSLAN